MLKLLNPFASAGLFVWVSHCELVFDKTIFVKEMFCKINVP